MTSPAVDASVSQLIILELQLRSSGFRPYTPLQDSLALSGCNQVTVEIREKVTFPSSWPLLLPAELYMWSDPHPVMPKLSRLA